MVDKNRCPMCGASYEHHKDSCSRRAAERGDLLKCTHYDRTCIVDDSIEELCAGGDANETYRRFNALVSFLLQNPYSDKKYSRYWRFFYEESSIGEPIDIPVSTEGPVNFNVANLMVDYPRSFPQQVDKVLLSLSSKYPMMGYKISIRSYDRVLYYATKVDPQENAEEIRGILDRLVELGYLKANPGPSYEITANGWIYIGELTRLDNEINQGFMAMEFSSRTKGISEIFGEAIYECGFRPCRIDEKEHNNQIVPEIFYEIKRSRFLVVDVTFPNYGAYYEAGYGEALNKEVIVCCSKEIFDNENKKDRPHFDIAQKSTVVWTDLDDLKSKLKARIEATVGLNSHTYR